MREEELRRRLRPQDPEQRRPPTREYAELKAVALLSAARMERPPVDVDFCANVAGIQLVSRDPQMGTRSAILSVPFGIPSVAVNAKHPPRRQRFSIAHEVGHWVLEREPVTHDLAPIAARGRRYDELERICNYFAGCLLMPRKWLSDRVEWGMTNGELVKAFDVSSDALVRRLVDLGYYARTRR